MCGRLRWNLQSGGTKEDVDAIDVERMKREHPGEAGRLLHVAFTAMRKRVASAAGGRFPDFVRTRAGMADVQCQPHLHRIGVRAKRAGIPTAKKQTCVIMGDGEVESHADARCRSRRLSALPPKTCCERRRTQGRMLAQNRLERIAYQGCSERKRA